MSTSPRPSDRDEQAAARAHVFTAERLLDALHDIGWMPCGDSPFWCFCKEPSEPGSHHTDGCITASGILALAGRVGLDADRPYPNTMTDSLGRSLAELQAREEAARAR